MAIRIIFCDDGPEVRDYIKAALRGLGHEIVGIGESGVDAIKLCEEHKPDLALLDLSMGAVSGLDAALKILDAGNAKQVLLMTSMAQAKEYIEKHGLPFIAKPIHRLQLGTKIDSLFKE